MKRRYLYLAMLMMVFLFNGLCTSFTPGTKPEKGTITNNGGNGGDTTQNVSGDTLKQMGYEAHQQINTYRRRRGLPNLEWSEVVYNVSMPHSRDQARSGSISHNGFDRRAQQIRSQVSANGVAENVAYNWNCDDPVRTAVQGWIDSPGHHANIVGQYTHEAIAVYQAANGAYYFTEMFYNAQ